MITGTVTKIHGPMMTLYDFVRQHKIDFQGCPVLRWMAANVAVEFTKEGLVKPIRPQNHLKIDGIISTAIALSRAALAEFDGPISIYDQPCQECNGSGEIDGQKCWRCNGRGIPTVITF